MVGAFFRRRQRGCVVEVGITDYCQVIAEGFERAQSRREFKTRPFLLGRPVMLRDAVNCAARRTMHLMAKAAVTVYEAAVENQRLEESK